MRVAYVCADPGIPIFGSKGGSIHVREVVRALVHCGAAVEVFAVRHDGPRSPDLRGVMVHGLPAPAGRHLAERERALLRANVDLRRTLRRAGPFDLVYERYSLWSVAGMEYARTAGIPGVLEVNAPLVAEQIAHRGLENRHTAERVAQKVFKAAASIVAVSREIAGVLRAAGASPERVHVIPNGVDPVRFSLDVRPTRPAASDILTVGFVGTLKPWHSLTDLADAFAVLAQHDRRVRLLVVGDGPGLGSLRTCLAAHGVDSLAEFAGAVSSDDVPGLLQSMDLAVVPYPPLDAFYFSPLKLYEYMAAGLPVVASDIGQIREVIQDGHTGLLYPPGDTTALAAALVRLRGDAELRARLGARARAAIVSTHTWEAVARRILAIAGIDDRASAVPCRPTTQYDTLATPGGD